MNIVYPYKHFNPAELIYSLKSLKNYKDAGEVFIIGDSPRNDITGFTLLEHEPATWAGCSRYKMCGNAVTVNAVEAVFKRILK